ncbi:MAG TPA: 50S ribosomal protein L23 [Candidatus Paceibacterota bacterium]|jgi:large subunit ribosomal protein L23
MALFSSSTKNTKASAPKVDDGRLAHTLTKPWFSEKALIGTEQGVYVFQVPASATKPEIKAAIEKFYGVAPRQVRIVNLPAKQKSLRTRRGVGTRARRHKAYVYLKKGDSIQLG